MARSRVRRLDIEHGLHVCLADLAYRERYLMIASFKCVMLYMYIQLRFIGTR